MASKDAMPFELLKKKLMSRLETMGIRIRKTYEEVILDRSVGLLIILVFSVDWMPLNDSIYYLKLFCMLFFP